MATIMYSPIWSFVQFWKTKDTFPWKASRMLNNDWLEDQVPGSELGFFLPVGSQQDLAFGVYVEASTVAEQNVLCDLNVQSNCRIYLWPGIRDSAPTDLSFVTQSPKSWPDASANGVMYMEKTRIQDNLFFFYWRWPFNQLFNYVKVGECFQFILRINNGTNNLIAVSNGMVRVQINNTYTTGLEQLILDGYTSLIEYRSANGDMGFNYEHAVDFKHKVRLPMYPRNPEYKEDEELYFKSDGSIKLLNSVTSKKYEIVTDYMPEWAHERLIAALKHDSTVLYHPVANGAIRKEGPYDLDYIQNVDYPMCQGSFKAYFLPFRLERDICGVSANAYVPGQYVTEVEYDKCGTHAFPLYGIVPSLCDGGQIYTIQYANDLAQDSIGINSVNGELNVHMKAITTDPVIIAVIKVTHPLSDMDTITVIGHYSGIEHC